MHPMDDEMRRCVDDCLACHRVCLTTFSQHCLDVGEEHVEPRHARLMLACAASCESFDDMQECAEVCRRCAESCRRMAA